MELTVEQKLDILADFEAQRDLIEANKRAALDEVKIPAEVEVIVKNSMHEIAAIEDIFRPDFQNFKAQIQQELSQIVIPEEIKAQLAEIDAQRTALLQKQSAFETATLEKIRAKKAEIQAAAEAKTRAVYDDVARRKREIEEEFAGNAAAVTANIEKLKAEIKSETIALKPEKAIKGKYYQSIYVKGRVTWNTDMIEGMVSLVPQLANARKEGEPSTQLRKL